MSSRAAHRVRTDSARSGRMGAVAPTLNTFDLTSAVRAVTLVVEEGVIW